jgi:hypothetical protein
VPQPGGGKRGDYSSLDSVRCLTALDCWAVGCYRRDGAYLDEALHWNGTTWSRTPVPAPAPAEFSATTKARSSAYCLAVGYDVTPGSTGATLNESLRWNGRKWRALTTLDPISATTGALNELTGLACSSATSCWGAGSFGNSASLTSLNQILYWNGTRWFEDQLPDPGGTSTGDDNILIWHTWAVGFQQQCDGSSQSGTFRVRRRPGRRRVR